MNPKLIENIHYTIEEGRVVWNHLIFHIQCGHCCGNGCRHCPYDPKHTNGKFIYPDFYLEEYNLYIEVFGMSEVPYYIKGMKEKIKLYEENNIKFIGINYENFKENNWKELLNNKLNKHEKPVH